MTGRRDPFEKTDTPTPTQPPSLYDSLRVAAPRKRNRQWEKQQQSRKVVYRGIDPQLAAKVKAIADDLREHVVLWAVQDLKIKREHLAQTAQVPDPVVWLNNTASKICGYDLQLQVLEIFEAPQSLVCTSGNGSTKIIFSPLSPADLRRMKNSKQNRLSQFTGHNPLLFLPKSVNVYEMSVLNSGYFFDLELALTWKALTGQNLESLNQIWMYKYS